MGEAGEGGGGAYGAYGRLDAPPGLLARVALREAPEFISQNVLI